MAEARQYQASLKTASPYVFLDINARHQYDRAVAWREYTSFKEMMQFLRPGNPFSPQVPFLNDKAFREIMDELSEVEGALNALEGDVQVELGR